jgi:DNA invertase Pin-like site-specific DNA recombinase
MDSGVEFVAVDNPHANKLTIHILAAVAEHKREAISERTKVALAAASMLLPREHRAVRRAGRHRLPDARRQRTGSRDSTWRGAVCVATRPPKSFFIRAYV